MDNNLDLLKAVLAVQNECRKVIKDGKNPHHRSNYPTLESVIDTLAEPLAKNKLVVTQVLSMNNIEGDNAWLLKTTVSLTDKDQHDVFFTPIFGVESANNKMQALGSAMTYSRRYSLMGYFNLAPTDDDGESLTHNKPIEQRAPVQKAPTAEKPRTIDDVVDSPGHYVVGFGKKFKGRTLESIPEKELKSYCEYIRNNMKGGSANTEVGEFLLAATAYLDKKLEEQVGF